MHEEERINKFLPLIQSLYNASKEKLGFGPHAKICIIKSGANMQNPLGKTAHYSPADHKIGLYTQGRHIKDILRSLSHELVHHNQNCRGDFNDGAATVQGYAQEDGHLREMEREAYERGNMIFRDWEDNLKDKGGKPLFTSTHYANAVMERGEKLMEKQLNESTLRNIIRGVIQEMFNDDLNEGDNMGMPADAESQEAAEQAAEEGQPYESGITQSEGRDYDTKGTPLDDPRKAKDPERYEKGKVGGKVFEDSGEEEKRRYRANREEDERRIHDLEKRARYDKGHEPLEETEELHESFFPKGRSTREKARYELNENLMKRWGFTKKEK